MSNTNYNAHTTTQIFNDPIAFLAQFGITAELVTETILLPTAA